jgi:hypothetical protein
VPHKFSVGQIVDLVPRILRAAAPGQYEVHQLMPQSDRDAGDPSYRTKSVDEKHERMVFESDLKLSARSELFAPLMRRTVSGSGRECNGKARPAAFARGGDAQLPTDLLH